MHSEFNLQDSVWKIIPTGRRREHSPSSALTRVSVGPAGSGSTTSSPQPAARSLASEGSALAAQVPDQPDLSFIAQFYDVDRSKNRTVRAKFWLASEHVKSKSVISVQGVGNCFWETLLAAGFPLGNSARRRESDGRALAYGDCK